nr:nitroreductase family protein [Candidatus Njordarchaeum guaymaensis]
MSILGIDYEKCANCGVCLTVCPRQFSEDKERGKVTFRGLRSICNLCGHCIARCPEDAILHKDIGESQTLDGVKKPETILSYDTLYRFLRAHRSIRLYKKDKVPTDVLQKVFDAMQYAPTAANFRSENFSILSDQEKIRVLSDAVQKELLDSPATQYMYKETFAYLGKRFRSPIYYDAPHIVFISSGLNMEIESNNIGIIVTYGRLAAEALGLGTCWNGWTQIAIEINPKIRDLAGIHGSKVGVFTLGYPDAKFYRVPPRAFKPVVGLR